MATPQQQAAAMARRQTRMQQRLLWFGERLERGLRLTMQQRLHIAVQMLRDQIVINLSVPVRKVRRKRKSGAGSYTWVDPASRSKPGEFPRAETTRLMKDIFYDILAPNRAIVGTSLHYGVRLELQMDRSFLRRTLYEMRSVLTSILTRGAGGGSALTIS